jgi:hypothetical protein
MNGVSGVYNPDHKNFAPRLGFAWDVTGKGNTVLRGGATMMYETINWESLLAFNNAFGLSNVPTGAIITAAGGTAGGTITAANQTIIPLPYPWDNGPIYGQHRQHHSRLRSGERQSLRHHERGPQHHHSLRLELDSESATCVHAESFSGSRLRGQSRIEPDRHSRHQSTAGGRRMAGRRYHSVY